MASTVRGEVIMAPVILTHIVDVMWLCNDTRDIILIMLDVASVVGFICTVTMVGKTILVSGFAQSDSADYSKDLLEKIAGTGTVLALKRRPQNKISSRAYAIVQFQTVLYASRVKIAAERDGLWSGPYYLTVKPAKRDIVRRPGVTIFSIQDAALHFGCLLQERVMSVLWSGREVSVECGFAMKTIWFYLSYNQVRYKLELSSESIWDIQLHCPPTNRSQRKFLLIQVQAAPKIYELIPRRSGNTYEDPFFTYFRHDLDHQWTRTTDFTPSASIGQSYILCLEVPHHCDLPNIRDYFVQFKEYNCGFHCRSGHPYSCDTSFVPVVKSPNYIDVPYEILFKINQLVQNGTLNGPTLDENFFGLVNPKFVLIEHIKRALEKMSYLKKTCLNPGSWLSEQYSRIRRSHYMIASPNISLDDGLVYVYRVQVTPAKVYFCGPEVNVSNRVVRHFSADLDNFLRISFVDEDCGKLRGTDLSPRSSGNDARRTALYNRVLSVLSDGITIGSKHFEFLAFSTSQLRDHSAWMFASRQGLTASDIRKWMGDFSNIRNVAKYAARLGQSFSCSMETLKVPKCEVEEIPDITNGTEHVFSDGVGKISAEFADEVATKCNLIHYTPSVFQIRYGGYKGVVAIDPGSHWKLSLRKSMSKFQSENITLDVLAYSKYQPCFLNRQIITLLSTLGVRDIVFEKKQEAAVRQLNRMVTDPHAATKAIELMPMGELTNAVREMLLCGYLPDHEPYLAMLLQTFRASKLQELKNRSRIFIPKGRAMMGCLDETRTLNYGQVFIQVFSSANDHHMDVVANKVVVAKNPCLHPGDIRIFQAVDIPALHHMVNCVVFPQQGPRPHPNECSGSDLDGDTYFVSWDPSLIPPRMEAPTDYTPTPTEMLDHDVTTEEVEEYFTNYIVNDNLGIISNAHVVFADKEPSKASSAECIELAKLNSIAVDFPKTGVPAHIPRKLFVKEYPDFMEKLDKATYISKGVIGKLYREIKKQNPHIDHFTRDVARRSYDTDLIVDGYEEYVTEAIGLKEDYDFKLGNLMDHYGIESEAEIVSGCILKMSMNFTRKKDANAIRLAVKSLRKEARSWFSEMNADDNGHGQDDSDAKASAWYHVTYHPDYIGCYNEELERPHFISFPWCVYDKLLLIKQRKRFLRRMQPEVVPLQRMMSQNMGVG